MKQEVVEHKETCPTCGHVTHKGYTIEYCDRCEEELEDLNTSLRSTVFFHSGKTEEMRFCSWGCNLAWFVDQRDKTFSSKDFYFVNLPHITDSNVDAFFEAGLPVTIEQLRSLAVRKE